jgi:A/G-specific adenine glycosylase
MNKITKRKAARPSPANPDPPVNPVSKTQSLVSALLSWFATNARDLPWRRTHDPYAIWVSEIMLQQTQVKTVIPYWERWTRELPTIESLADASADKIHKLWEGLGYYTRVRNLQKAAQQIIAEHGGQFPQTFEAVLALPGIGRYTAGAICSIAFNQPTPILDGNVIRVLTRIHGIKTDPREKQTNARLWQLAGELVGHASTGKFQPTVIPSFVSFATSRDTPNCSFLNQSLMELGALICTPGSPNCVACPAQKFCVARKENLQDQLPNLAKREAATERRFIAFVVERDGKFLVRQRPEGVVNAHLWEFPNVEVEANAGRARHSVRAAHPQTEDGAQRADAPYQLTDFRVTAPKSLRTIKHSITRYRITLEAWRAELASSNGAPVSDPALSRSTNPPGRRPALQGEWRTITQLHQLAFTSAHKKILANLSPKSQS